VELRGNALAEESPRRTRRGDGECGELSQILGRVVPEWSLYFCCKYIRISANLNHSNCNALVMRLQVAILTNDSDHKIDLDIRSCRDQATLTGVNCNEMIITFHPFPDVRISNNILVAGYYSDTVPTSLHLQPPTPWPRGTRRVPDPIQRFMTLAILKNDSPRKSRKAWGSSTVLNFIEPMRNYGLVKSHLWVGSSLAPTFLRGYRRVLTNLPGS
jgi:hypothetical protein